MQVLAPLLMSPFDTNTIYFGSQYLFRSRDRGDTWEKLTGDMSSNDKKQIGEIPYQDIISISESPKKKGLIYTGTDDGRLYMSLDEGKEWNELTASLSSKKEWIGTVLASRYDERTVYVSQQGRYDEAVERLDLAYPKVDADAKKELKAARAELDAEKK